MTNVLGFDPARIVQLGQLLADLNRERARMSSDDPAADAGLAAYRQAVEALLAFSPRVAAVASCRALTEYPSVSIDPIDPAFIDVLPPDGAGAWAYAIDPLTPVPLDPLVAAAHLGTFLKATAGLLTDDELAALAPRVLALSADSVTRHALVASLGADGFRQIVDDAVTRTARSADALPGTHAMLSAVVRSVAGEAQFQESANATRPGGSPWRDWVAPLDPYPALVVLSLAPFPSSWSADLAQTAWHAIVAEPHEPMAMDGLGGDVPRSAADVLVDILAADPDLARRVLATMAPEDLALLAAHLDDRTRLAEVLVHVTDRHEVADDPAGPVVVNVARAFSAHPDLLDEPLDRAIGYVLGSHLTHVVDLDDHAGMVTAHWDWSGVDPVGFLRMMSTRTAAADEITGWLGFTVAEESESILAAGGSEEVQHARMAHLGSVAGTTVTALLDAGEARARRALADWDKMWSSFSRGLGIISKAFDMAIPPREIVSIGIRKITSNLAALTTDHGWLGAPEPLGRSLDRISDQARAYEVTLTGIVLESREHYRRETSAPRSSDLPTIPQLQDAARSIDRDRDVTATTMNDWQSGDPAQREADKESVDAFRASYGWATDHRRTKRR